MGSASGYPRSHTQCRQHLAYLFSQVRLYCCGAPGDSVYHLDAGVIDNCLTIFSVHMKGPVQLNESANVS